MSDSPSSPERPQDSKDDVLELNKDLERMIEDAENISVQLTCMAYDMVALRTSPELGASMRRLEEVYHSCRAAMEIAEKTREQADATACADVENILKSLDSLSNCMDQLALRAQLRQCDLIVCVGCPDKLAYRKDPRCTGAVAPSLM